MIKRYKDNPIITVKDIKPSREELEVLYVTNPGVARLKNETILLLRVAEKAKYEVEGKCCIPIYNADKKNLEIIQMDKDVNQYDFNDPRFIRTTSRLILTTLSHLRVARSKNGINFEIEDTPALFPENKYEEFGVEDARITQIDDVFYITYTAVSPLGVIPSLASTKDFNKFTRYGAILHATNKDVVLFPRKINGQYLALHRPMPSEFGTYDIWLAESPDLIHWGKHVHLLSPTESCWDSGRVGAGTVPFEIEQGWLEIYHGATHDHKYCVGALLLDKDNPQKILAVSKQPIMIPEKIYETKGFFGSVVFPCGAFLENGTVKMYYGAADTCVAYAEIALSYILEKLTFINA